MSEKKGLRGAVASGLFWKFSERMLAQGISFFISIILARILMPEAYGSVAIVLVFISIAEVFITGGFNQALIQKKDATKQEFSTIFYCSLIMAVVLYIILFFTAPYIAKFYRNGQLKAVIRVCAVKLIIASYNSIQHAYVSRHLLFKRFFFSTLVGTVVSGIVGLAMAFYGFGVWALIAQYLINSFMDTVILGFTVDWHPQFVFAKKSAKKMLAFGGRCLAANLIGAVFNNLRSLIIGKFYTEKDLAYYNKGKNFPDLIVQNLVSSITSVLFPAISNVGDDPAQVKRLTRRSLRVTSYIIFPMMAGMAAVAGPMIRFLLTDKWKMSVPFLQMACAYCAFHTVTETSLQSIKALGRSDIVLRLEYIKKPVNLGLILLALFFGNITMVALTLPAAAAFAMFINMIPNTRIMSYKLSEQFRDLLPATVMSLIMMAAVLPMGYIPLPSIVVLAIQGISGAALYVLMSVISKNESFAYCKDMALSFLKRKKEQ